MCRVEIKKSGQRKPVVTTTQSGSGFSANAKPGTGTGTGYRATHAGFETGQPARPGSQILEGGIPNNVWAHNNRRR